MKNKKLQNVLFWLLLVAAGVFFAAIFVVNALYFYCFYK